MMKNVANIFACVAAALAAAGTLCLAGCMTVDTAKLKNGSEHIVVNNYGWKFFGIPIFCGNAENGAGDLLLFRDDVTMEKIQKRFDKCAKGRKVMCPVYDLRDTVSLSVFSIPIPYLLTYKEITLSGTVK